MQNEKPFDGRVTREELFEAIWSEPMGRVAAKYNVTKNHLTYICRLMGLPRPTRGDWAPRKGGELPEKPRLPDPAPEYLLEWFPGSGHEFGRTRPQVTDTPAGFATMMRRGTHPMIVGAKEQYESARQKQPDEYLKPSRVSAADLFVSRENLAGALKIANRLIVFLEHEGHRVYLAPPHQGLRRAEVEHRESVRRGRQPNSWDMWQPDRPTVVLVRGVPIGHVLRNQRRGRDVLERNSDDTRAAWRDAGSFL